MAAERLDGLFQGDGGSGDGPIFPVGMPLPALDIFDEPDQGFTVREVDFDSFVFRVRKRDSGQEGLLRFGGMTSFNFNKSILS